MLKKTRDYDSFIFREDNRDRIRPQHVKRLIESIRSRNLLEFRPVVVNGSMEVIDGQHRILAAKALGVEIYYQMEKSLDAADIIKLNISESWNMADYLNFYILHGYVEYIKLRNFMDKNKISLKVGMSIALGQVKQGRIAFKAGEFKFNEETLGQEIDACWETIGYINKMNGFSAYTESSKFWNALLKLIKHPCFDVTKWRTNMKLMVDNFSAKTSEKVYVKMLTKIYNWKNQSPIYFTEEE